MNSSQDQVTLQVADTKQVTRYIERPNRSRGITETTARRRLFNRLIGKIKGVHKCVETLNLILDERNERGYPTENARLAAMYILDQSIGKPQTQVQVDTTTSNSQIAILHVPQMIVNITQGLSDAKAIEPGHSETDADNETSEGMN